MRLYYSCSRYSLMLFLLLTLPCSSQVWWKSGLPETSFAVHGGNSGAHLHASQDRYAMNSSRIPYLVRNGLSDVALTSSKQVCAMRCDSLHSDTLEIWFAKGEDYWSREEAKNSPTAREGFAIAAINNTNEIERILLFGGQDEHFRYGETWIYNPNIQSWRRSITQRYPLPRIHHQLCGIAGKDSVLLFGGVGASGVPMNDIWMFDYSAQTWMQITTVNTPNIGLPVGIQQLGISDSIVISDGNTIWLLELTSRVWSVLTDSMPFDTAGKEIFMAKGQYNDSTISLYQRNRTTGTTTSWNFDVRNRRWYQDYTQHPQPPAGGCKALVNLGLTDAVMLLVNSGDSSVLQPWFYSIHPSLNYYATNEYWSPVSENENAPELYPFTASTISNSSEIPFGGLIFGRTANGVWQTWQYGLVNDTYFSWKKFSTDITPKGDTSFMSFAGGQGKNVLVTKDSTWTFDWATQQWLRGVASPPFHTKFGMTAISLGKGQPGMIAVAADTGTADKCATWIFDCIQQTWRKIPTSGAPSKRTGCAIAKIEPKFILLYGGNNETGAPLFDTWLFDFTDSSWVNIIPATNAKLRLENPMIVSSYSSSTPTILAGISSGTTEWQTWKFILKTAEKSPFMSSVICEADENDGSFSQSLAIYMNAPDSRYPAPPFVVFDGQVGEDFLQTKKTSINSNEIPEGLTPHLIMKKSDVLELTFSGKTQQHSQGATNFTVNLYDSALSTHFIKGVSGMKSLSFFLLFRPNVQIETLTPELINSDSTVFKGFLPKSAFTVLKHGFVYAVLPQPSLDYDSVITSKNEDYGSYSVPARLQPLTHYYIRAFCQVSQDVWPPSCDEGICYGNEISFITAPVSSTESPINLADMEISPNPADDNCFVPTPYINSPVVCIVADALGNIVVRKEAETDNHGSFTLDVSRFPNGVYLLGITSETGHTTFRITVLH